MKGRARQLFMFESQVVLISPRNAQVKGKWKRKNRDRGASNYNRFIWIMTVGVQLYICSRTDYNSCAFFMFL